MIEIGNACFCRADTGDAGQKCDCDAMSSLSAVYLGKGLEPAASIVIHDGDAPDEFSAFVCLFEEVSVGQELECLAGMFPEETSFSIEGSDGEICEGTLDTSCEGRLLHSKGEGCDALQIVVTGYVGTAGEVCDDGYAPCDCQELVAIQGIRLDLF